MDLEMLLTVEEEQDISGTEMFHEIKYINLAYSNKDMSADKVLQFIIENKLISSLPNIFIAIRILLTLPVSAASAERSLSKLNLIKTNLRTTMIQERLNGLSMISIEKDILKEIEIDELIKDFASAKARKKFM